MIVAPAVFGVDNLAEEVEVSPAMMTLEVQSTDGGAEKWLAGGPAINRMEANGWTKATVKPGDVITGVGYQFADGQKIVRLERIILPDGKELRVYGR